MSELSSTSLGLPCAAVWAASHLPSASFDPPSSHSLPTLSAASGCEMRGEYISFWLNFKLVLTYLGRRERRSVWSLGVVLKLLGRDGG